MDSSDNISVGLQIEDAFNSIGTSMYSDDLCCKILAYTLCFGGANEAVVKNQALHFAIRCSAKKLNISGGEIPNGKLLPILQQRIQELAISGSSVEWLDEIKKRYGITIPETKNLPEYLKMDLSQAIKGKFNSE